MFLSIMNRFPLYEESKISPVLSNAIMPRKTKYRTELDVRFISFYDFLMGTDRKPSTCEYGNLL